ncbi:hypothetical protein [Microbulbifer epialgicus]|uniref:GIY-YIG domain-containing protein n=1 Tax=Microbulbifer epialgicus TaxID=393907 RepID=A0ABV4P5E6_9GAMM
MAINLIDYLSKKFLVNDFRLDRNCSIRKAVSENNVSNEFGVYLIFAHDLLPSNLLYIGKAGEINQKGNRSKQGIAKRLCNKQEKIPRVTFFKQKMNELECALVFAWAITMPSNKERYLPGLIEAEMMQLYFVENGCLPQWNNRT